MSEPAPSNPNTVPNTVYVLGSPCASSPILESLISEDTSKPQSYPLNQSLWKVFINSFSAPGSIRTYTPLKTLSQGPFGSVHVCHWHSTFPPCVEPPPLPTIARYGVERDLIALKIIPIGSGQDPNKLKELEVCG